MASSSAPPPAKPSKPLKRQMPWKTEGLDILNESLVKAIRNHVRVGDVEQMKEIAVRTKLPFSTIRFKLMYQHDNRYTVSTLFVMAHGLGCRASQLLKEAEDIALKELEMRKRGRVLAAQIRNGALEDDDEDE